MSVTVTGAGASWSRRLRDNIVCGLAAVVRTPRAGAAPAWRAVARVAAGALAAIAVIALTMIFVDGRLAAIVKPLPPWLIAIFATLTDFGKSGWFLWPLGILLLATAAAPPLSHLSRLVVAAVAVRLGFLFVAIAAPSLFATIIKRVIGRARPYIGEQTDPFRFMQFVWHNNYASLPSGHATTAFAAATAIGLIWPRARVPMFAYALVIAASRVVLTSHYASDVIAGALVGVIGALLVRDWFAARRLGFAIEAGGAVRRLPGPSFARIKRVARNLVAS